MSAKQRFNDCLNREHWSIETKKVAFKVKSFLREYSSYFYLMFFFLVFLTIEEYICNFLVFQSELLQGLNKTLFGVLLILITLCLTIYFVYTLLIRGGIYISNNLFALYCFVVILYSYYRFCSSSFVFWHWKSFVFLDVLYLFFVIFLLSKCIYRCSVKKQLTQDCLLLGDKPILSSSDDLLDFSTSVSRLFEHLKTLDTSKGAFSVGINAGWGKGKSSYLNMLKDMVDSSGCISICFNARSSKSVDKIQEDFFTLYSNELAVYYWGIKKILRKYVRALGLVGKTQWLQGAYELFENYNLTREKQEVNNAIDVIGKRIYVIIDDLDRLTGEEVLEVFKLIERNGDFHHTIFISAYDKIYINSVLKSYLSFDDNQIGVYTDKYFEYEISLPGIDRGSLMEYTSLYIKEKLKFGTNEYVSQEQILETWRGVGEVIVVHLESLRHLKRYINLFITRFIGVKDNVDCSDFFLITLLRYKDPEVYNALFLLKLIHKGVLRGSSSILYLNNKYEEELKGIANWEHSSVILERLFYKDYERSDLDMISAYQKIRMVNSFHFYFCGKMENVAYIEDLLKLFDGNDDDSFKLIDEFLNNKKGAQLEEFLRSRSADWIQTKEQLNKYIKLLTYYVSKAGRPFNGEVHLQQMLYKSFFDQEIEGKIVNEVDEYKSIVKASLQDMIKIDPILLGFIFKRQLEYRIKDENNLNPSIFDFDELSTMALECQSTYLNKWGTSQWDINKACIMSQIPEKSSIYFNEDARRNIFSLMRKHPDLFAKALLVAKKYANESQRIIIGIQPNFMISKIFPIDNTTFASWIDSIKDNRIKLTLEMVYESIKHREEFVVVGDLNDDEDIIDSVLNIVSSIYSFTPFEVGDIVMIKEDKLHDYTEGNSNINNLFVIKEISDSGFRFNRLYDSLIPLIDILPVPVDGVLDKNIYFDPIIPADVVGYGQELPVHTHDYSYYLDRLKSLSIWDRMSEELRLMEDRVFVHEIQHWMREEMGSDDLKIRF